MEIFLISFALISTIGLVAICLGEVRLQRRNRKLEPEEVLQVELCSHIPGLLALPVMTRCAILKSIHTVISAELLLNGISPTTSHLQSAPNKPVGLALADGKVHDGPRWG